MRTPLLISAAVGALVIAACSKDSPTGTSGTTPTTPKVYDLSLDSGQVDSASAPAGTAITVRIHLKKAGVGVGGSTVTWNVAAGHGTLSSSTTTTDANGATSVNWTLGDTAGLQSVSASSQDAALSFRAVATAGPAASLTKVSADSATVVATASLPLTVRITDKTGNPVTGAVVGWTTSANGKLSAASTASGSSGNAQTVLTTSAKGTYTVTATLPGKGSVTFTVIAI